MSRNMYCIVGWRIGVRYQTRARVSGATNLETSPLMVPSLSNYRVITDGNFTSASGRVVKLNSKSQVLSPILKLLRLKYFYVSGKTCGTFMKQHVEKVYQKID